MLLTPWSKVALIGQRVTDNTRREVNRRLNLLTVLPDTLGDIERSQSISDSQKQGSVGNDAARAEATSITEACTMWIRLNIPSLFRKVSFRPEYRWFGIDLWIMIESAARPINV